MITNSKELREYKKKYNFFETPEELARKAADLLDVGRDLLILEPSAGLGRLLIAAKEHSHPSVKFEYCEIQTDFDKYLVGFDKVGSDFLRYHPGQQYDAIIMNPPYHNKSAEKHIDHAWDCLKSGGRIVAFVGAQSIKYIDKEYCGYVFERELIKNAFADTNVDVYLILIIRPVYE